MREGGEWEGREKRGKGREESEEGRGKWGQKEFDEKTNKQTNKQTTFTNGNEENQAKLPKNKFKTSHKLVMQHLFVICFLA